MTNETEVKLSKHLSAAVNAIQKEIDRKNKQMVKLKNKAVELTEQADALYEEVAGLHQQQSKLKGE